MQRIGKRTWRGIAACLAVLLTVGWAGDAKAATLTVTTGADKGEGSLRQAVLDANATAGLDEIQIDAGVRVITLASEVNISSPIMIRGGGVTVKGSVTRLFSVTGGTAGFDRITFTGGNALSGGGGAVNIDGPAKADFVNCTFFDNGASADGGAVCVASSSLDATTFLNCTIAGNSAMNGGGVAVLKGTTLFTGSIVTGNTERGALPQRADIYGNSDGGGVINAGRYNVIGHTNLPASFPSASEWGNYALVGSADVFQAANPLALTTVDGAQVLKLSSLSANVALDRIPTGSAGFPKEDERGGKRPQLLGLDAGAFELSPVPVASVDLTGSPYIQLGHTESYSVAVHPSDATRDTRLYKDGIEWFVSDPSVISVDRSGVVSALRTGDAILYAQAHGWDASGNAISTSSVSLGIRVGVTPLPVPEVTLKPLNDLTVGLGATQTIRPEVVVSLAGVPAAMDYRLSAFSSNTGVASADVSADGKSVVLAGRALGTAQITVTAKASNRLGSGVSDPVTFALTVSDKRSSGGGGGCDAGVSGLALAFVGAFLISRRPPSARH